MDQDKAVLLDIARAARLIVEFVKETDKTGFLDDIKTQSAVMHQLMVMGEAVKRLSDEFVEAHAQIPWSLAAKMRDKLIHGYDVVDLEEVWRTATADVPNLVSLIEPLLPPRLRQ
jgi:uncharacterized protein with HEPN domain